MKEFKPCPFCGSEKIIIESADVDGAWPEDITKWAVSCKECHASSAITLDRENSITLWNRRKVVKNEKTNG